MKDLARILSKTHRQVYSTDRVALPRVKRTNWFIVVEANGKWWVDNEGRLRPFPSREAAALEALDYARKLGDLDRVSQVFWPDEHGRPKLIRELDGGTIRSSSGEE